jgi:hypothetical protein
MARKSIASLYTEVLANATQFVNEFKRADNEARRATASVRASVGKMTRDIARDFSLPKLGKGLLQGFGLGGGMQLMSMATDKFVELLQSGSKHAEELSEHIKNIREDLTALHDKRFSRLIDTSDIGARPEKFDQEIARTTGARDRAQAALDQAMRDMQMAREGLTAGGVFNPFTQQMSGDAFEGRFRKGMSSDEILEDAQKRQGDAIKSIESLNEKLADLEGRKVKALEDQGKEMEKMLKEFFDPIDKLAEAAADQLDAANKERRERFNRHFNDSLKPIDPAASPMYRRWEQAAGGMRTDELTRRGLGTGANYRDVNKGVENLLKEIRDAIRAQNLRGGAVYQN